MEKLNRLRIGLFDSGIGGFSILRSLLETTPFADYFYVSDNAFAPYGPKSDEVITERSVVITELLLEMKVDIIVVACNTATAASIDFLRSKFPDVLFVGVEPYLNAYYKLPESKKVAVLTTVSTGKSERFKKLKDRLDPSGEITQVPLENLAYNIEQFYAENILKNELENRIKVELSPFQGKFTHVILGCTHYPLVKKTIEEVLKSECISPCPFVALRVREVLKNNGHRIETENKDTEIKDDEFHFYETNKQKWVKVSRSITSLPFQNL